MSFADVLRTKPMFSELIPKSSIMHYSSTCLGIFFCVGKNCTNISKFILITSQCGSLKKRSYLRFQICRISISKTLAQFCCLTWLEFSPLTVQLLSLFLGLADSLMNKIIFLSNIFHQVLLLTQIYNDPF